VTGTLSDHFQEIASVRQFAQTWCSVCPNRSKNVSSTRFLVCAPGAWRLVRKPPMLRSGVAVRLKQVLDFAEYYASESPVRLFNPWRGKALLDRKCIVRRTTVLSTTRFPKAVGSGAPNAVRPEFHLKNKTSPNSSPNCAPKGLQIVLFAPPYSVDYIDTPCFTTALLTDRL
jgi:hypothetical protein